jgi:hypothetical protein
MGGTIRSVFTTAIAVDSHYPSAVALGAGLFGAFLFLIFAH